MPTQRDKNRANLTTKKVTNPTNRIRQKLSWIIIANKFDMSLFFEYFIYMKEQNITIKEIISSNLIKNGAAYDLAKALLDVSKEIDSIEYLTKKYEGQKFSAELIGDFMNSIQNKIQVQLGKSIER